MTTSPLSKQFWQTVLDEYQTGLAKPDNDTPWICPKSITFSRAWRYQCDDIQQLCWTFLSDQQNTFWEVGDSLLFFNFNVEGNEPRIEIRLAFLNWCIQNAPDEQTPSSASV